MTQARKRAIFLIACSHFFFIPDAAHSGLKSARALCSKAKRLRFGGRVTPRDSRFATLLTAFCQFRARLPNICEPENTG
ncbi:hypothetical protein [Caballeronia temeraria]|uniref:hypothetical protein n=1 Tax=Caballeronia temeraria TaxID=1777137 RepID=UPI001428BEAD|nr:hypothetical protein [Caballeronia temeraria]